MPEDHATYSGNFWNLFEVSYIADGKVNNYTYDARGNRLNEVETYGGASSGKSTDYEYYENSDLIKKAGNWYFNYDKNGNLLARGTEAQDSGNELFSAWTFSETDGELWTYEYDLQNRMTKASYSGKGSANLKERGSYIYDYRGLLVKKTYQNYNPNDLVEVVNEDESKPVTEFYEYTADGRVIYNECTEDTNTKKTTYIWANTTLWCEVNNGVVYYHHTDHLGTTEVVTDSNGTVVWEAGYEAFGSVLSERGESSFTPSYTGKFFDKASGLYYFNARWYDSELGKFTTQDPIRDGVNWWNYCNGNPISFLDFTGEICYSYYDAEVGKYGIITYDKTRTKLLNLANNILDFYPYGIGEFGKAWSNFMTPYDKLKVIDASLSKGHLMSKNVNSMLEKIDIAADVVDLTSKVNKKVWKGLKGDKKISSAAKVLGKVSDIINYSQLLISATDSESYIMDNLVIDIYSSNLMGNTRSAVEKNYDIARESINNMIENGNIIINKGNNGTVNYQIINQSEVDKTIELFNKDLK